jgi:hypothetical protein
MRSLQRTVDMVAGRLRSNPVRTIGRRLQPVPVRLRAATDVPGASGYEIMEKGRGYPVSADTGDMVEAYRSNEYLVVLSVDEQEPSISVDIIDTAEGVGLGGISLSGEEAIAAIIGSMAMQMKGAEVARALLDLSIGED